MLGLGTLGGVSRAVAIDGLVLVEALALHLVYGSVARVAGPAIRDVLEGE